jgi:hypothetical protein
VLAAAKTANWDDPNNETLLSHQSTRIAASWLAGVNRQLSIFIGGGKAATAAQAATKMV